MKANIKFEDDKSILNDDNLWRKIPPTLKLPNSKEIKFCVYCPSKDSWRVTSVAFQFSSDGSGMSVLLEKIVFETKRTANDVINNHPAIVSFTAGQIRNLKLGVYRDPQKDELAHANVFDFEQSRSRSEKKKLRRNLAAISKWVVNPKTVE